jgi:hypothetical protein
MPKKASPFQTITFMSQSAESQCGRNFDLLIGSVLKKVSQTENCLVFVDINKKAFTHSRFSLLHDLNPIRCGLF